MRNLLDVGPSLHVIRPLAELCDMLPSHGFYIVGGAIRDALLGKSIQDIDITSKMDPTQYAREFALRHGVPWFWLDKKRRQSRVIFQSDNPLILDFAPLRAPDLLSDLAARDFTINSLALPLSNAVSNDKIIDPLQGLNDLRTSTLRMAGKQAFVADPLRILKGIRHSVVLNLNLEKETSKAMSHHAWRLDSVAVERVRHEVWTILSHPSAEKGLSLFYETGIGARFWGAKFDRSFQDICHRYRQACDSWFQLANSSSLAKQWLIEPLDDGLSRRVLLLWTILLEQINKELPFNCAEDWLFSRKALSRIRALTKIADQHYNELKNVVFRPRPLALWAQKHGWDLIDFFLYAFASSWHGFDCYRNDLNSFAEIVDHAQTAELSMLVDGSWLASELSIKEGPQVGIAMALLRDAEISGLVANEDEAKKFLRDHYLNKD